MHVANSVVIQGDENISKWICKIFASKTLPYLILQQVFCTYTSKKSIQQPRIILNPWYSARMFTRKFHY